MCSPVGPASSVLAYLLIVLPSVLPSDSTRGSRSPVSGIRPFGYSAMYSALPLGIRTAYFAATQYAATVVCRNIR